MRAAMAFDVVMKVIPGEHEHLGLFFCLHSLDIDLKRV